LKYENPSKNVSFTIAIRSILKHIFYLFLYLNIYTIFSSEGIAQQLHLEIETQPTFSKGLQDTLNIQSSFIDFKNLRKEVDTLQWKLERLGFIESSLEELKLKNDSTYIASFNLGKRYTYIKVYYAEETFSKKDLTAVSENVEDTYFTLRFPQVEATLEQLNLLQTQNGDAFASLQLSEFRKESKNTISAQLQLTTTQNRTLSGVVIKGYEKFPKSFLTYFAGIKKGQPFNKEKLIEQNNSLNNLGFVKTTKTPEALFKKDSTTAYLYLEKRNNNLFDGIIGFNTNEETQRLEFNGYLNLELNNNLNFGEQLLINYKADGREQLNFRVATKLPYLFSSPVGAELELKIFKRDSTFSTTDQQAKLSYQFSPTTNAYIGYKGYESSNLLDNPTALQFVEDYTASYLTAGIGYSKNQNNSLFPIKAQAIVTTEIGTRETESINTDQFRISGIANYNINLNVRNSVFLQNTTSILSSDTYLTNELFRFGGITSIRGFNENSIDASLFSVFNTEYRYQFNNTTYVHSIIDLAYFENETIDLKQQLYSFGIGFGLQTDAGIFKFNIANGNSDGQDFNFSNTKIHLSLSSRF